MPRCPSPTVAALLVSPFLFTGCDPAPDNPDDTTAAMTAADTGPGPDDGGDDDGGTDPQDTGGDGSGDDNPGDDSPADDGTGDDAPADDGPTDDGPGDDTGPQPTACDGSAVATPGVSTGLSIVHDGAARMYDLFIPTGYDPTVGAPLVLNFHGLAGNPGQQAGLSQFNSVAEPWGMVVAYPQGVGNSFNGGTCCGSALSEGIDDVGFARALVSELSNDLCIDPSRVFVTGMSNGGHMAHRIACEAADVFAAAASVTGVLTTPPQLCNPSRPISVMDFHGDADPIVPFGGTGIGFPAVPTMMADWAARNGCQGGSQVTFEQGDMRCETWTGCSDDVETTLCVTAGGGHCWPGAGSCLFGNVSSELSASATIAEMFMSHPM